MEEQLNAQQVSEILDNLKSIAGAQIGTLLVELSAIKFQLANSERLAAAYRNELEAVRAREEISESKVVAPEEVKEKQ